MFRTFALSLTILSMLCGFSVKASTRKTILLNNDWKFILHDIATAYQVNYDDHSWRTLNLPHDWAFENGYSKDGAQTANGGYASGGIGWEAKVRALVVINHKIHLMMEERFGAKEGFYWGSKDDTTE